MTHIVDWPANLRPIDATIPFLSDSVASSRPAIKGNEGIVEGLAARWVYGFRFKIWTPIEHLSWRAFHAQMRGRAGVVRVPICDCRFAPKYSAPYASVPTQASGIPYSESGPPYTSEVLHSDGTGFSQDGTGSTLAANVAANATSLIATMEVALDIMPGHFFTLNDRLYEVSSVSKLTALTVEIGFAPRLRRAAFAGSSISFARLNCLMTIPDDSALRVDLSLLKFGNHSIEFVEAVT